MGAAREARLPIRVATIVLGLVLGAGATACLGPLAPPAGEAPLPDIPFTRTVLDNGLTLVVHEDRRAPIVAVSVWYRVGSKDEPPGRTGFAHLFEHLMFQGSENHDDDWFVPFERVGATGMNGTTNWDVTRYFQTVPTTALDMALWMESDRMGHLLGVLDAEKLEEQRGVVKNEKRDRENQSYGRVHARILEDTYPAGHPYAHSVIGSLEDLDAATLEDARNWFLAHYGAANAVLVVAGDVETAQVEEKVRRYFGDVPPGPPRTRPERRIARRREASRAVMQDRVPFARLYRVWNLPETGHPDVAGVMLAADVLAQGRSSRLHRRLVLEERLAKEVSARVVHRELGSQLLLAVTARPGEDLAALEERVDEELARLLADGPDEAELARARTARRANLVRVLESVGGFSGRAQMLAASEVQLGDPGAWRDWVRTVQASTPASVHAAAREWLAAGAYTLEVHPFPDHRAAESGVDRSGGVPEVSEFPTGRLPQRESFALANGLEVVLARRPEVPLVELDLLLGTGFSADPRERRGRARLALDMLEEGTSELDALAVAERWEQLGARFEARAGLDTSSLSLSALAEGLDASLALFAEVALRPAFPAEAFSRRQQQQLDRIRTERANPRAAARRLLPGLLFGPDHPYGQPLSGSGDAGTVQAITRDDLVAFHEVAFRPADATLVVVGDVAREQLEPLLERHLGAWSGAAAGEARAAGPLPARRSALYLVDRPGSEHSVLLGAGVLPPEPGPDDLAIAAVNETLGGAFTSRLNLNLREDKGWAYGARSSVVSARGPRPLLVSTSVQADRTGAALAEMRRELRDLTGPRPPSARELAKFKDRRTLTLPGRWETNGAIADDIGYRVRFGLPETHWDDYADRIGRLELSQVVAAAREHLQPDAMLWLVVGDRARIAEQLAGVGLGEPIFLDAEDGPAAPLAGEAR